MCGIVGYLGKSREVSEIVKTLKKLEYRGYDSAGVCVILDGGETLEIKETGNISNLEKATPKCKCVSAIAHTRWATHGKPTKLNAHPHSSKNGEWSIVHNGIIENYVNLKNSLKNKPESQTDTAVLAQLLEEKKAKNISEFIDVMLMAEGSYAIVAKNKNFPNELFLAKDKSPLYVSVCDGGDVLVASDPICFVGFSKEYYTLASGDFAHVKGSEIVFYNQQKNIISKTTETLGDEFEESEKAEFSHFMIKEIMEQPSAIKRQVKTFKDTAVLDKFDKDFISKFTAIKFVGCGTAYNAGLVGARFIEKLVGVKSYAEMASEFIYSEPVFADSKTLFVFVSQSGETADTLRAEELAKQKGASTIALTNVLYSSLARNADYVIPVCAGPEIAVASTKAYVCQLTALYMFASNLSNQVNGTSIDYFEDIMRVADKILNFDFAKIDAVADELKTKKDTIFIGKDIDYVSSGEASLKLKEVGYINSANYPSGELKHGYLALVEDGTPLVVLATSIKINQKTFNSASEATSRGAKELLLTNESIEETENRKVLVFDEKNELLLPMLVIAPLQYLAYKVSVLKGINPDQPRNLAKSVTVE